MRGDVRADQDGAAGRVAWRMTGGAGTGGPLARGSVGANPWSSYALNVCQKLFKTFFKKVVDTRELICDKGSWLMPSRSRQNDPTIA